MHTSVQMNKRSHNSIKAVTMPNSDYKTPIILQHHNTVQFLTCVFNINIIKCHSMNLFKNSNNNILIRYCSAPGLYHHMHYLRYLLSQRAKGHSNKPTHANQKTCSNGNSISFLCQFRKYTANLPYLFLSLSFPSV